MEYFQYVPGSYENDYGEMYEVGDEYLPEINVMLMCDKDREGLSAVVGKEVREWAFVSGVSVEQGRNGFIVKLPDMRTRYADRMAKELAEWLDNALHPING